MTTTVPRATLTTSAPSGSAARKRASTRPRVWSVIGTVRITTSAHGSSPASASNGSTGTSPVRRPARHPAHLALEPRQPPLDRLAPPRRSPTSSTRRSASDGRVSCDPGAALGGPHVVGDPAQRGQRECHGELRRRRVVHALRVAQRHALGHQRADVVDTRRSASGPPAATACRPSAARVPCPRGTASRTARPPRCSPAGRRSPRTRRPATPSGSVQQLRPVGVRQPDPHRRDRRDTPRHCAR